MSYLCEFFFLEQKTAYEMRISDWRSDVCSSDLRQSFQLFNSSEKRLARALLLLARYGKQTKPRQVVATISQERSEERRVGKSVSVRVDLGGRRIINKKKYRHNTG